MKYSEPEHLDPIFQAFVKLGRWGEIEEERLRNIVQDILILPPNHKWGRIKLKDIHRLITFYNRLQSLNSHKDVRDALTMRNRMHEHLKYDLIPRKISQLLQEINR